MHTPDLIQRIYFEKHNGNDLNYEKVFNDLWAHDFDFIMNFDFDNRKISWTCFESKKYEDIIKESDGFLYFYLWDSSSDFEIIIPASSYRDELNKPICSISLYSYLLLKWFAFVFVRIDVPVIHPLIFYKNFLFQVCGRERVTTGWN